MLPPPSDATLASVGCCTTTGPDVRLPPPETTLEMHGAILMLPPATIGAATALPLVLTVGTPGANCMLPPAAIAAGYIPGGATMELPVMGCAVAAVTTVIGAATELPELGCADTTIGAAPGVAT